MSQKHQSSGKGPRKVKAPNAEQALDDSPENAQEFEMEEGEEDDLFDNNGQDLIDKNLQEGNMKYGDDDGDDDDHVQSD